MFSVAIELGSLRRLQHYRPLPVSPGLRGYAAENSQLRAAVGTKKVSLTGLAARFCPTGRDLYFGRRHKEDTGPDWARYVLGHLVDTSLYELHLAGLEIIEDAFEASVLEETKRTGTGDVDIDELVARIQERGNEVVRAILLERWEYGGTDPALKDVTIDDFAEAVSPGSGQQLIERTISAMEDLVRIETEHLARYLRRRRFLRPFLRLVGIDWRAEVRAMLTRLECERQLDKSESVGAYFGISGNVVPDILYAVTLIGDVKSGTYHDFYDGVAVSYVVVAESILKRRINTAAILSVDLDIAAGKVRSHHLKLVSPTDEMRRIWITQRDTALQIISAEVPPRFPDEIQRCPECPYSRICWVDGKVGGTPIPVPERPVPEKKNRDKPR